VACLVGLSSSSTFERHVISVLLTSGRTCAKVAACCGVLRSAENEKAKAPGCTKGANTMKKQRLPLLVEMGREGGDMKKHICTWFATVAFCPSLVVALVFAPAASAQVTSNSVACQVAIDSGIVAGVQGGDNCVYKGIPYAAAPVGSLRWQPPAPVVPWSGVRSAANFGNICPQLQGATAVGNEDCLNLNIYAPEDAAGLPVIFFIHGGGNRSQSNRAEGGTSLDGTYFAEHGRVIVVVINYRLGALGWLAHPSLDAESATGTSGNYGILDQIAALRWVQRNIATFGGDPSRVMITGHSAGATDTGVLLASPLAQGLFSSAFIEGAGPANFFQRNLADYESNVGMSVVAGLGCAAAANIPACLRALPSATIVKTVPGGGTLKSGGSMYQAVVDGVVLFDTTLGTVKRGLHNRVPLIIGGADKESSSPTFIPANCIATAADYQAAVYDLFGQELGDQVLAAYPLLNYPTPRLAFVDATTDYRWIAPARMVARAAVNAQKEPVYRMLFTHAQSNPPAATALGAWHGEELMFLFHSFSSGVSGLFTPTAEELAMSDQMIGYWSRFAANHDPNGEGAVFWPEFGKNVDNKGQGNTFLDDTVQGIAKKEAYLRMDVTFTAGLGYHTAVSETLWDKVAGDTNNGHAVRSDEVKDLLPDNAGNEKFLTDADLDNSDKGNPPPLQE
jgi:para-nitrobenzyl esterase